jgi:hypothetical protein
MTPETQKPASTKAKRVSPELAELVSMLSALEQRNVVEQVAAAKS